MRQQQPRNHADLQLLDSAAAAHLLANLTILGLWSIRLSLFKQLFSNPKWVISCYFQRCISWLPIRALYHRSINHRPRSPQDGRHTSWPADNASLFMHQTFQLKLSIEFLYFWNSINFVLINICNYARDGNALERPGGLSARRKHFDWTRISKSMKTASNQAPEDEILWPFSQAD